jgi:protein phosphatase
MRNQGVLLEEGTQVVICSDGLSDLVDANAILRAIQRQKPQAAVDELILLARRRGGHDNITVIVLKV